MPQLIAGERLIHSYGVPTRGVWRQLPAHQLPPDALWDANNVVCLDGQLQPRAGVQVFTTNGVPFSGTPTGAITYLSTAGATIPVLGTRNEIYKYDTGTLAWSEITGIGITLTANENQLARFTTLVLGTPAENWLVHVNGKDDPRVWNGTGTFSAMLGSPPKFTDVATIADRIVGLVPPFSVRWYNTRSVSVIAALNEKQLAETPDRVVAIASVGQVSGIVWKEDSLWSIAPTGQTSEAQSFRFDLIGYYEGPAGPAAVVDANGVKVHMTPSGRIGMFTGSRVVWIADGLWPLIRADIRKTSTRRIFGWFNADTDVVSFIYPSLQADSTNPMRGRIDIVLPKPEAGVEVYGTFPGLMGEELRAALPVLWTDSTRDVLLFGSVIGTSQGTSWKVGGTDDNGVAIAGHWRTGLVQTPQANPMRFEGLEVFARRGTDQGVLTLRPVVSWVLADDGQLGDALPVLLEMGREELVRAPRGWDVRGRFLGIQLEFDDATSVPVRYKGSALYAQKTVV